jgi:hypothetical protein
VQGEHALAALAHGHTGEETLEQIYERPDAFLRPYMQDDEIPSGADEGMGSLTQADVTPGAKPTEMYGDNQPGEGDTKR